MMQLALFYERLLTAVRTTHKRQAKMAGLCVLALIECSHIVR